MSEVIYITAKDFLRGRIDSIKNLVKSDVYLSFLPITVLIEVIGKINNPNCNGWNCESPKVNFNIGIDQLPEKYQEHKSLLYKSLRCGFAHSLLPQLGIDITHRSEALSLGTEHLKTDQNGNVIIVAEELMDDIEQALNCSLLKDYEIDNKVNKNILFVNLP